MTLDFTGIIKRRVPFVPYVQLGKIEEISKPTVKDDTGQVAQLPVSAVSSNGDSGHAGQAWTHANLETIRQASSCYDMLIIDSGHSGHAGHVITRDDVEYFDERAAIAEFEGGMSRAEAEKQAFAEWQAERMKRTYH